MPISVRQFARSTLRAPLQAGDLALQLAVGSGAGFQIAAGDYGFITLYDGLHVEVVRYVGSGVAGDDIAVTRAQDGTLAQAFPLGTCAAVTLNLKQMLDYVRLNIDNLGV